MRDLDNIFRDLCEINHLISGQWENIPKGKRGAVPQGGFRLKLPPERSKLGTDEKIVANPRTSSQQVASRTSFFDEANYFENPNDFIPDVTIEEEGDEEDGASVSAAASKSSYQYVCPQPDFEGIGHAEFENLLLALPEMAAHGPHRHEASALITGISCLTPADEVHLLLLDDHDKTIRRTPPRGWEVFTDYSGIHQQTKDHILYSPPPIIIDSLKYLRSLPNNGMVTPDRLNTFLREISHFITVPKLNQYLLRTGPDAWGYSAAAVALSFRGIGPRPGVFASYVRGDALFRSLNRLYELIQPGSSSQIDYPSNAFGCAHVPRPDEVRYFALAWRKLITEENRINTVEKLRAWHNAVVAGLHLFGCILLGGIRNYRGAPPCHADLLGHSVVNCEKYHNMPLCWSRFLADGLNAYRQFRNSIVSALQGSGFTPPDAGLSAYCFWGDGDKPVDISSTAVTDALKACPETERWQGFHVNAFRALGMTILYESMEFHTHDIERFYGRTLTRLSPLSSHRMEPALDCKLQHRIEISLRKKLGI